MVCEGMACPPAHMRPASSQAGQTGHPDTNPGSLYHQLAPHDAAKTFGAMGMWGGAPRLVPPLVLTPAYEPEYPAPAIPYLVDDVGLRETG